MKSNLFLSIMLLFVLVSSAPIGIVGASSEMWKTIGGEFDDKAAGIVVASDGGYAIAGTTSSFGAGSYDFWLVKTNEYGDVEWNQTYGGADIDHAYALVETSDGGYAIAGSSSFGASLVKTDAFGNVEWNQTYSGWRAFALVEASDGGYALSGSGPLVKTDKYGNMEWNQTVEGVVNSLVATSDGGYALAGALNGDFWLAKADEQGVIPEFPSWIILPLFFVATLFVIVFKKRLFYIRPYFT